jgi:hypothetical protein
MTKTQSALERVIIELDSWCDNWTPTSYNDPRISLRQIADRARNVLEEEKKSEEEYEYFHISYRKDAPF